MTTSADINPNYITAAAVGKQATRDQLQIIKDSIAALEGVKPWRQIAKTVLVAAASTATVALPAGYDAYRVEFAGVRGVTDSTALYMRVSINTGVSWVSTGTPYSQTALEALAGSTVSTGGSANELGLATGIGSGTLGAAGVIQFPTAGKLTGLTDLSYVTPAAALIRRSSAFLIAPGGTPDFLQFQFTGGSPNLAIGSTFTVLGRLA